jgi:hypothetical protein
MPKEGERQSEKDGATDRTRDTGHPILVARSDAGGSSNRARLPRLTEPLRLPSNQVFRTTGCELERPPSTAKAWPFT